MKNWIIKHKTAIKKWGLAVGVIYLIKALIYTGLIIWATIKFSN